MRRLDKLVSIACLAVILGGIRYAVAREHVRDIDLHTVYQEINREFFAGELEDARIQWGSLTDARAKTYTYAEGSIRIVLDTQSITSGPISKRVFDTKAVTL